MQKKLKLPLKLYARHFERYQSKLENEMNRIFIISFVAFFVLNPSISFADFKVAEFTFLPTKSNKVIEIKSTVRDSLKEDRSQKQIDQDINLTDEQVKQLIGNIVLNK